MKRAIFYSSLVLATSTVSVPLSLCSLLVGLYFILKGET